MNLKERSPFYPGSPVPVEFFVGRSQKIDEILNYVKNTINGKQENIFLLGSRGIGKSSLASFLKYIVSTNYDMMGVHVFLGKVTTLDEMIRCVFERLLKDTRDQSWFDNIKNMFGKYIRQIGLFGISITFSPPAEELQQLVRNFPEAINNILSNILPAKKGLLIILDDINGLAGKGEFADWYKSFADEVATHYQNFPLLLMLVGLPEKREVLSALQPSLMRIFRPVEIDRLSDEEVHQFFARAFESVDLQVSKEAMNNMVTYASGLPLLMHEIGDAVFWTDRDGYIDEKDAIVGVYSAAEKVGEKYLEPKVYKAISSDRYISILRKLGKDHIPWNFKKRDIENKLSEREKRVFHNFLRKMRELGVIETERERGSYKFVNEIYPIYIWMESTRPKRR
jgi:energy-coupling factor transporter ATP-binding protein EcfA2